MTKVDDAILVQRCLNGNNGAFESLIDRYQGPIFNLALRVTGDYDSARDVAQTAFIKVYESLGLFDKQRGFFSWLYKIAVNEAINFNKKERRRKELAINTAVETQSPEAIYELNELSKTIWSAIDQLQLKYRVIIMLKYFGYLSYNDISFVLDIPEKKVKSRLYTARNLLHDLLRDRGVTKND